MAKKQRKAELDIRERHSARQKRRRRLKRIRSMFILLIVLAVLMGAVMFLTPVFNIQAVKISGNQKVLTEEIQAVTDGVIGQNLFKVNLSQMKSSLSSLTYLKDIKTSRVLYPPSLKITVSEASAACYANTGGGYALIDDTGKILEIVVEQPKGMPEVTGIQTAGYTPGTKLSIDESDKFDIILLCIREFSAAGINDKVWSVSVADKNMITFAYDGRLDVICGSSADFSKKISLFKEVVTSNRLPANSRGTIDLSTAGKAIYTP